MRQDITNTKLLVNNAGGMRELDFTQADLLSQDLTQEIRANLDGVINMTAGLCCLAKT